MSRRVFVAGGAGFLGSHLCERLLANGDEVVAVDNLSTGHERNIGHLVDDARFTFRCQDICEPFVVDGEVDLVLNFASPASPPRYSRLSVETLRVGSVGTEQMLRLAVEKGSRFVHASTSEVYGDPSVHPQTEQYWGNVNPLGPSSMYDEAKRFAEAMIMAYHCRWGVDVGIVRIFNTYGPRLDPDDGRVVSNFLSQALHGRALTVYGDGSQTRSFCYVDDEIDGILLLAASTLIGPVNIGNPEELTMLELAEIVHNITGRDVPIVHEGRPGDDPTQRCPDISLAQSALGWKPTVDVADGLRLTAQWFQSVLGLKKQK